jgi:quinoprotein glucose dehydrogenase
MASSTRVYRAVALLLIAVGVGLGVVVLRGQGSNQRPAAAPAAAQPKPYTTWSAANGTPDSANYSALTQINRSNVTQLEVAWSYNSGDQATYAYQPLVAGRTMFVLAQNGNLAAIDAGTGKELWVHKFTNPVSGTRGINYWQSKDGSMARVFLRAEGAIQSIDAKTGELDPRFGINGKVPLEIGMTAATPARGTSPGQVFENLLILGSATGEAYGSAPADIRAFDVLTGRVAWVFHTIPHPGEPGYETWPKDAWTYAGGAANWGEMSVDEKRGIVYIPTGSPKNEFWGGDRIGDALYGTCILALEAGTGKKLWHYQAIHHDIWEYELVAAPQLLTIRQNGQNVDVVAQASKNGFLYVLNRVTGKPIWPIPEKAVPPSDVAGEVLSKTQPFPTKPPPFERQRYGMEEVDKLILNPEQRAAWIEAVKNSRNEGLYTPISDKYYTMMFPGHSGGAALFSTSSDPTAGLTYVISFAQPALLKYTVLGEPTAPNLTPRVGGPGRAAAPAPAAGTAPAAAGTAPAAPAGRGGGGRGAGAGARGEGPGVTSLDPEGAATAAQAARGRIGGGRAPFSYPPGVNVPTPMFTPYTSNRVTVTPPYSTVTAYDLNTGTIKWQIPYGEAAGPGMPPGNNYGYNVNHGPKSRLGITAGGLAFQAGLESKARAYDKDTGKILWEKSIVAPAQGAPAIYEVDGRQFVAFTLRGSYIAFALPRP